MNTVTLSAHGLFRADQLHVLKNDDKVNKCKGIYIWGIISTRKEDLNFVPLYVGEHENSILDRVEEHFLNLHFGNKYRIFEPKFYDALLTATDRSLIPLVPSISAAIKNKKEYYQIYSRFYDECVFECDPIFLRNKMTNTNLTHGNFLLKLNAKSITSQGYDYHFNRLKGSPIQDIIDVYFSEKRFGFILIPVEKDLEMTLSKLEGNIKGSLKGGTLSNANRYDPNIEIRLNIAKGSSNLNLSKIFRLGGNNILQKSKYANEK